MQKAEVKVVWVLGLKISESYRSYLRLSHDYLTIMPPLTMHRCETEYYYKMSHKPAQRAWLSSDVLSTLKIVVEHGTIADLWWTKKTWDCQKQNSEFCPFC